jgi:ATP-dependent protease ClpP protease subunit
MEVPKETPVAAEPSERRTLRWLLGGQIGIAILLVLIDLGPTLPGLFTGSDAPDLTQPVQPGDQRRLYDPRRPRQPGEGMDPDMPRRLTTATVTEGEVAGITLRGAIEAGDGARIVAELRATPPAFVIMDSPGGAVSDALMIGRVLRDLGADTRVADGAVCLSACPYMFVGGTTRTVNEGGRLGVHQHSFGQTTMLPAFLAAEDIQRGQAEVLDHLVTMGIDLRIMGPALATPADEIYILTQAELTDWAVVTE